jgi:hypothetical protein
MDARVKPRSSTPRRFAETLAAVEAIVAAVQHGATTNSVTA